MWPEKSSLHYAPNIYFLLLHFFLPSCTVMHLTYQLPTSGIDIITSSFSDNRCQTGGNKNILKCLAVFRVALDFHSASEQGVFL